MGCKWSCCKFSPTRLVRNVKKNRQRKSVTHIVPRSDESCNLQHISEREQADDIEDDPSSHPTVSALFMHKCDNRRSYREKRMSRFLSRARVFNKSSSCSTIFIVDDSTVSHPNLVSTIRCVTLAINYHINHSRTKHTNGGSRIDAIFDEMKNPLTEDGIKYDCRRAPDHRTIYNFMSSIFSAAQLPPECAIITLVYIERLMTYAEIDIRPETWRRILLGAILLASKVWDDQAVWNIDYCHILRGYSVEDLNEFERHFLELIQFNVDVPASVYVKYYFSLRSLADQNDLLFTVKLLSKEKAQRIEAMSKRKDDRLMAGIPRSSSKKWSSADNIFPLPSRAILS